ncbi:uncharacterized protein LOC125945762 [Dermacentor silvarum]|uniref:uncharacterized protein LOC125945762 n=1 Tax=Dermacentor silvarum TaxID=543639 RepID=UPI0021012B2C|nr:uncharacterized protein LOC125945762 [Dermacentor silvarum]
MLLTTPSSEFETSNASDSGGLRTYRTAKCVKYSKDGKYENFSSPAIITYAGQGSIKATLNLDSSECYVAKDKFGFIPEDPNLTPISFSLIYTDCVTCSVMRHRYAGDGYGCTYWRRADSMQKPDDCCKFIYDENCGTSPKYVIYDSSCGK